MKIFHRRPPPYYILRNWLKKLTWKRFHFFVNFFTKVDTDYHWESVEPLAHVTGNENAFKCKQLHERHTHVSGFRIWLVKSFTKIVKSFTKIVKYFTQFLSITKLFDNVNVYSLVFVDLWRISQNAEEISSDLKL